MYKTDAFIKVLFILLEIIEIAKNVRLVQQFIVIK